MSVENETDSSTKQSTENQSLATTETTTQPTAEEAAAAEETRRAALTDEERTAEDAAKVAADAKPSEPEPFVPLTAEDIKFADGVTVDEPLRDEFLAVVNNQELSVKDRAQALVDLQTKSIQALIEQQNNEWNEKQTERQAEVKADKEIGGDKLQPVLGRVGRLLNEYGSKELLDELDASGVGNSIHALRFFDKVADKLVEGEAVTGTAARGPQDAASRMYPSMKA